MQGLGLAYGKSDVNSGGAETKLRHPHGPDGTPRSRMCRRHVQKRQHSDLRLNCEVIQEPCLAQQPSRHVIQQYVMRDTGQC